VEVVVVAPGLGSAGPVPPPEPEESQLEPVWSHEPGEPDWSLEVVVVVLVVVVPVPPPEPG
jgi:hypothetical protein